MAAGSDKATVACQGAVGWVSTSGGVVSLADAVNQTRNSSVVEFNLTDITLTADAFVEAAKVCSCNSPLLGGMGIGISLALTPVTHCSCTATLIDVCSAL